MDETTEPWRPDILAPSAIRPSPEMPRDPMEFLSRSWSVSALEVSRALSPHLPPLTAPILEDPEDLFSSASMEAGNSFSFASSATSQLVMDRIMSQLQEASPRTSGRLSHSSGPLTFAGSLTDSPPVSPSGDDTKYCRTGNPPANPPPYRGGGSKTVGRWLKDRRERKKEESRTHNAQLHAAVSVAGVAAAVAAITAATAAASRSGRDDRAARTELAVASAATLVAAQCVEAAEAMGAEREQLAAVVGSAVSVRTAGDIITLTAAAATALGETATLKARVFKDAWNITAVVPVDKGTALRGAATLKARVFKDAWNIAAVIPVDKGTGGDYPALQRNHSSEVDIGIELVPADLCSQELLARGTDLLKCTRKGALHRKLVSVYINRMGQVMLKMKSRHVAGTITKKKKSVVIGVCKDVPAWPCRPPVEGGERRYYFGLRTAEHRVIEFECRGQREHEMWTQGVSRLLSIVGGGDRTPRA